MKILLLELSGSDSCSRNSSRYGGVGPTYRRLAENIDNCFLAALESCFEGDITDKCISLNADSIKDLKSGLNGSNLLDDYDVLVYSDPNIVLNAKNTQICWAVGQSERIHPEIKHLLLHDKEGQYPIFTGNKPKIHEFVLGVDIPAFQTYDKQDFIVQITNHYPQINSITLAQWALNHRIKTIFAGPINDYPLLDFIDYETTFYLGQIKQEEKVKLLKKAKLCVSLYSFPINGPPLFFKEGMSFGCGFMSTPIPSMGKNISVGNGFLIQNEEEFVNAWNNRNSISQKQCWDTANNWSIEKMVDSFKLAIEETTKL